jgi:hypothetical protein
VCAVVYCVMLVCVISRLLYTVCVCVGLHNIYRATFAQVGCMCPQSVFTMHEQTVCAVCVVLVFGCVCARICMCVAVPFPVCTDIMTWSPEVRSCLTACN